MYLYAGASLRGQYKHLSIGDHISATLTIMMLLHDGYTDGLNQILHGCAACLHYIAFQYYRIKYE